MNLLPKWIWPAQLQKLGLRQWYLVGKRRNTRLLKWYESYEVNIESGEFEHKVLYVQNLHEINTQKWVNNFCELSSVDNSTNTTVSSVIDSLRSLTDSFLFLVSLPSILAGILRSLGSLRSSHLASGRPSQPSQWASRALASEEKWSPYPDPKGLCSDCFASTELTRLGEPKCLSGEKSDRLGGWT